MAGVNEPELHGFQVRCARCGRGLGRWLVFRGLDGRVVVIANPRPHRSVPSVTDGARPARTPFRNRRARVVSEGFDLECTCHRGLSRRRVRISAHGLLRLVRRLGSPDEIEL